MSMWDLQQRFRYVAFSFCIHVYVGSLYSVVIGYVYVLFIFRVRIVGIDNLRNCVPDFDVIYVDVGVFHGGEELCKTLCTQEITASKYPRWNQWLVFNISVKNLPKVNINECNLNLHCKSKLHILTVFLKRLVHMYVHA